MLFHLKTEFLGLWLSAPFNIRQDFLDLVFWTSTCTCQISHQGHAALPSSFVNYEAVILCPEIISQVLLAQV